MTSLRRRLILGILTSTALLLVATGVAIYLLQRRALLGAFDQALLAKSRALRSALRIDRETGLVALEPTGRRRMDFRFPWRRDPRDGDGLRRFQHRADNDRDEDGDRPGEDFFRRFRGPDDDEEDDEDENEPEDAHSDERRRERPGDRQEPLRMRPGQGDRSEREDSPRPQEEENPLDLPDWFRVQTMAGTVLLQSDSPDPGSLPAGAPENEEPTIVETTLGGQTPARMALLRFELRYPGPPNRRPPPIQGVLMAAEDTLALQNQLSATGWILLLSICAALLLAGLVAWGVSAASLKPVGDMAERIGDMREDRLDERLDSDSLPVELQPVARRLNDLLARVGAAFRRERGFTADVAHELRTPLAGLTTATEVALGQDRPAGDYRQALTENLQLTRRMQQLVEKLLMLARLDAGQWQHQAQTVSLRRQTLRSWQAFVDAAQAKDLTFTEAVPPDLHLQCDERLLGVILSNLLANAVQYTPPGGKIHAQAGQESGTIGWSLTNTVGTPLTPEQLQAMFERFWRADVARSATGMHCGLGLSLVQRCVEILGATVRAEMPEPDSLRISVTLPPQPPSRADGCRDDHSAR